MPGMRDRNLRSGDLHDTWVWQARVAYRGLR